MKKGETHDREVKPDAKTRPAEFAWPPPVDELDAIEIVFLGEDEDTRIARFRQAQAEHDQREQRDPRDQSEPRDPRARMVAQVAAAQAQASRAAAARRRRGVSLVMWRVLPFVAAIAIGAILGDRQARLNRAQSVSSDREARIARAAERPLPPDARPSGAAGAAGAGSPTGSGDHAAGAHAADAARADSTRKEEANAGSISTVAPRVAAPVSPPVASPTSKLNSAPSSASGSASTAAGPAGAATRTATATTPATPAVARVPASRLSTAERASTSADVDAALTTKATASAEPAASAGMRPTPTGSAVGSPEAVLDAAAANPLGGSIAAPPLAAAPVASRARTAAALPAANATLAVYSDQAAIRHTLQLYEDAYERLDARAAAAVWPTLDLPALSRAFDGLKAQLLQFDRCDLSVGSGSATAICSGSTRIVRRIGSSDPLIEPRQWTFHLRRSDTDWKIESVSTRR